ncbi:MAG: amidohydrolase family protein [Armatimonadota bacterium]
MIIDAHVHISDREGCVDELLKAMDDNGIDMAVVFDVADSDNCLRAAAAHPDRLIPFGSIGWGYDDPKQMIELADRGARGMKVIRPAYNYNDERLLPYWGQAEELGLPCMVHTGIVARHEGDKEARVDTARMKVIWLDAVCRWFPDLTIIAAHMGNPDHEEGSMMARWHPNFYFDLSGSSLLHRSHEYFRRLFWWDKPSRFSGRNAFRPFEKMVFATDEPYDRLGEPMREQRALLEALGQDQEMIERVFGGTIAEIVGLQP